MNRKINADLIILGLALHAIEEEDHEYLRGRISQETLENFEVIINEIENLTNTEVLDALADRLSQTLKDAKEGQ